MENESIEVNELDLYLTSIDDVLSIEKMPDGLKLDEDAQASLAYNIRHDIRRNDTMRNGSARASSQTTCSW